ncbi:MAG: N-6 DNA methylase, partial [Acidimicrobiia bacterium]|nr:N-6 DNA methylase [Acidimicrobiia bacterium]
MRSKPHVADVGAAEEKPEPRLVVPVERPAVSEVSTERDNAVTQAMADKKTMGQRKKANETALDIVSKAAQAGRGLTDEEAIKVAQYTGKGGISGDLNQFYTPVKVAEAMWDVLAMYSDEPVERVLEPSCGSGVFLQTARKGAKVTGVELDSKAAAVSDALHGHTHTVESKAFEEFTIENLGGKPLDFDGVIANPPYCTRTGDIPLHKADFKSADKYFIDTSVDHLKDGGVATLLIHPGVLNNKSPGWQEFRERLLARCEIVDAFRLPNTTFKHVHCGIPADVLVLKKRDKRVGGALVQAQGRDELESVLKHFDAHDETFISGDYFESRPERVLGQALSKEETGWRATVEGDVEDVPAAMYKLADAQSKMVPTSGAAKPITYEALAELAQENEALKRNMQKAEGEISEDEIRPVIGATRDIARSRYVYLGDPPRWQRMDTVDDVTQIVEKTGDDAIKQAHTLSKEIADLIQMRQTGEYYKARTVRRTLAERVKTWVTEHGIPGSHKALGELSKSAPQLLDFLGAVDSNGELSDALSKDAAVTLAPAEVDKSDLMSVADFIARRSNGYVLPSDLQHNWEGWESESEDELRAKVLASGNYALDSTARANPGDPSPLQHIEDYLTGNLYTKLDAETARMKEVGPEEREHIRGQIAKLKERLETKQRSIDDIPIQLRVMGWMPSQWFSVFLNSDEGRRLVFYKEPRKPNEPVAKLSYENGLYELQWVAPPEGGVAYKRTSRWGPGEPVEVPAGTLISRSPDSHEFMKYLNRLALKKEQVEPVENEIEPAFNEWIKGSEHRDALEDLYNRTFNADFRREYSGDPLPIEGLREGIVPHHYQNQAVRWAAETGRGILGQDVGLGKTFIGILLAKIRKQEGKAKRPMVVVPKSVATNWAEEVETLIPGSRVLVIGEHRKQTPAAKKAAKRAGKKLGLTGDALDTYVDENSWVTRSDNDVQRNQKLAMVKQNEYDLIICTKPAFDRIPLRPETTKKYEEEDFWYQRAGELEAAEVGTAKQQTMDKKIAKRQAEYAQQELARKFKHREDMVYWEDMEIDTLMADEAHCFPAGTLVDSRPIESYKAGDVIRAFDHATGEVVKSEVVNVQLRAPDDLFRVRMEDGTALVCTGQHPLYTSSDGYVLAKDILEGDILYKNHPPAAGYCGPRSEERTQGERGAPIAIPDGPGPEGSGAFSTVRVAGVEAIEPTGDGTFGGLCPDGVVYNLEVKDHHTYMAEGVLVHNCYKNLYSARSRNSQKPKFLGGSGQSKQARKMQFMAKFVREKRPTNGVYFMTATPTKNSPLEVFNMLAHIAPEEFQRIGIENSEQFIDRFCRMEMQDVITAPGREKGEGGVSASDDDRDESKGVGNIESQLCVTGFKNLKELEGIMDKYMMIQTATDVGLKIPDRNNVLRVVDMTDEQEDIYDKLRAQAANVDPREDPGEMFRVFDRMKKAAQDLELYDPEKYSGWYVNSPKYTACVDAAYEGAMSRGGQLIFCDHNASHARLKAMLVEKGLKESEVGIINASVAKDSAARQAIGNRFNRNEIKVVIGNTGTMGEGVNLQGKKHAAGTTDIHHLDQPWDPGTFHQRNGRGVRQGNKAEQVQVHTYISKGSFDGFRDSSLRGKGRWLDKLRSGADSIANDMDGQSISDMEREAMVSQDPEQAMARIKEMAAKAKGAWYAKQAKGAVDEFHKWQKKHDRLRRMKRDSPSRQKLMADVERLKRQLLRSEVLPDPIKDHLESGDTSTVGVATFIDANDKWTARILRPGDVIRSDRLKHVVVAQDLSSGKLK